LLSRIFLARFFETTCNATMSDTSITLPIRLGAVGLGRAFTVMVPTFALDDRVQLVGGADPNPEARQQFEQDFGGASFESLEALLDGAGVDAVYLATPVDGHVDQVRVLAAAGVHVLMEKPMALTVEDCLEISRITDDAGVHLLVGHSHSFDTPYLKTRDFISDASVGQLRMMTALNYTDFMYRPRRPDELDTSKGGGVVFSQAAHQIDILRLIGGGKVKSVRAATGNWDPARPTEGAYSAFLTFEDGAVATAVYSGYAHFDSDELLDWQGELGALKDQDRYWSARDDLAALTHDMAESSAKASRNYGGALYKAADLDGAAGRGHQHFGSLLISCEKADLRPFPDHIMIYGDRERTRVDLPKPTLPRAEVIDELVGVLVEGRNPIHSGAWATATLEVCLGILESAATGKEIQMSHQCGLSD